MARRTGRTAGEVLAQAEGSIGTTVRKAVDDHYRGLDLSTAQAIRGASTDTEAAKIITAIRQGRVTEVLMIAASAASGAVAGAVIQRAVNNATMGGVPAAGALGVVPVLAGLAAPISLSGRAVLAAGGLTYIAGTALYNVLTRPAAEAAP